MSRVFVGIDTGGTFTDLVAADLDSGRYCYHKAPTTTGDPSRGILEGIAELLDQNSIARRDVAFLVRFDDRPLRCEPLHVFGLRSHQ